MEKFVVSVLKGISEYEHTTHFVLYDLDKRVQVLHSIFDRQSNVVRRHIIIDEYTNESGYIFPCFRHSASGESTNSSVVVYSSLVVVYSSLMCLQ